MCVTCMYINFHTKQRIPLSHSMISHFSPSCTTLENEDNHRFH